MMIREMPREECHRVLAGARLARLACAHENQPYVVPAYLAYQEPFGCFYGFTTPGQMVAWMRANPLVCVEVDAVTAYDQWVSVIAFGRYEELAETPGSAGARCEAQERPGQVGEDLPAWSADRRDRAHAEEGCDDERRAWQVLQTHPMWAEPACSFWAARARRDAAEPFPSVYYRIRVDRITGYEATRDGLDANGYAVPAPAAGRRGWWRRTLARVFGGRSQAAGPAP